MLVLSFLDCLDRDPKKVDSKDMARNEINSPKQAVNVAFENNGIAINR